MSDHIVIGAPATIPQVDTVWVFVSVDPKTGFEAVCAAIAPGLGIFPLFTAEEKNLLKLKQQARVIAHECGMAVRLVRLTSREELEVFEP